MARTTLVGMSILPSEANDSVSAGELSARYDQFVLDLLGGIAYQELSAFEHLSSDARYSPTLKDRAILGRMAVSEFGHFEMVCTRIEAMGLDPELAMHPFARIVDSFHSRTRPGDWHESLMKAYVVDALNEDFYAGLATNLDEETRKVIAEVRTSDQQRELLAGRLKQMLNDDPRLASRLALWGRRLVGEALTQTQSIGAKHSFLMGLRQETSQEDAQQQIQAIMAELRRGHSKRMSALGLTA